MAFRLDDEAVARAEDAVHRADRLGAKRERGDGLGASDLDDLRDSGGFQGIEQGGIDRAIRTAGSGGDDFRNLGGLGEARGHQCGGNERGLAAGDIDAHAIEGREALTHRGAFRVFE